MMTKQLEENIREQLAMCGQSADVAEAVINYYRQRDGEAREDVLLNAVDDGFLTVCGWCEREGPLYHMPDPTGGPYWQQLRDCE